MLVGPLFQREAFTVPRHVRHFGIRAGYVAALCVLLYTAAQNTFGFQPLQFVGDVSRFGLFVFEMFATVQLVLVVAASLLLAAGSVAQEKDKRTLILLLMTDLKASELVIGKALASLLNVAAILAVSLPVFCMLRMLGGITVMQIVWIEVLCLSSALAAAAWGTLVAYWREKTFQTIAISVLGAALFLGLAETVVAIAGPESAVGRVAGWCNPFRALSELLNPFAANPNAVTPTVSAWGPAGALILLAIALWIYTCIMVRVWNPSKVTFRHAEEEAEAAKETSEERTTATAPTRPPRKIWDTPIAWREICTQAYGRKVGVIKAAYFVLAGFALLFLARSSPDADLVMGVIAPEGLVFIMLSLVSLLLVNAQAVTALTSERDGQTLELLLVTEVTAKEFIFGKLAGILFNAKEVIVVPLLLMLALLVRGSITFEAALYVAVGFATLILFSAMLGVHTGLSYEVSRAAILNSLGTMFFLFVGIFVCMMLIVEARTSFALQLAPFLLFIFGGSLGLWMSLTRKNPSPALTLCACILPFLTFYAITSFLLANTLGVCLAILGAYGFTTIAMLIPAVSAFDVALGRTSLDRA